MENTNKTGFEFDLPKGNSSIIKVIGVGGGGNNALKHMYERGIHGVDFVICNTDAQTLNNNPVSNKVQLGITTTEGLGAGADPEVGEKAAIESIDEIKSTLGQNTKMVFITAGMGGGTGTGAAPIIAKAAKEMGILTVAIVTVPFSFEGKRRLDQAEAGLEKLRNNVDSLIVINNDKLRQQFGNLGFKQGFSKADEVLTNAAKGMAEVITGSFVINIDFRDAKSVLQNSGTALMSTGSATGEKRAEEAVKKALDSPLLNDNKITGAQDVLLLIQSGSDEASEATMDEIGLINDYIQNEAGNTANIIFGVGTDEELGDAIRVLVIATGFTNESHINAGPTEVVKVPLHEAANSVRRESPFKISSEAKNAGLGSIATEKNIVKLDEDDDFSSPQFSSNRLSGEQLSLQEVKPMTYVEEVNEEFEEGSNELDLFSYDEGYEEPKGISFTFDTKDESSIQPTQSLFLDEKPVEFSFKIKEEKTVFEEEAKPTSSAITSQESQMVREVEDESVLRDEEIAQEGTLFTFIEKKVEDSKVQERRNKLKEFNSRYQNIDEENVFETIPAFRRKNIKLDDSPSDERISSFLADNNGRVELRENKFLNKDVD
ncbi:cell division protein FtsZ [Riemerella anatipestifer]|uniref:cell division protein FtsZ n=1 Tax=Riemerella anatipestifer TaxID=34085 RepID=UPI001AD6BAB2|nr:cell division protein FtsZ [Riemerella anatipestifer]MBO4234465.1 cell division protein FtsZ [Riemerella anatipestifer]